MRDRYSSDIFNLSDIDDFGVSSPITVTGGIIGWDSALTANALTWTDGLAANTVWTFANTGTDTTMTASSALMMFSHNVNVSGIVTMGTLSKVETSGGQAQFIIDRTDGLVQAIIHGAGSSNYIFDSSQNWRLGANTGTNIRAGNGISGLSVLLVVTPSTGKFDFQAGALETTGIATVGAVIIPNGGFIGSVGRPDAIQIDGNGLVTFEEPALFTEDIQVDGNATIDGLIIPVGGTVTLDNLTGPAGLYIDTSELITHIRPNANMSAGLWKIVGDVISPIDDFGTYDVELDGDLDAGFFVVDNAINGIGIGTAPGAGAGINVFLERTVSADFSGLSVSNELESTTTGLVIKAMRFVNEIVSFTGSDHIIIANDIENVIRSGGNGDYANVYGVRVNGTFDTGFASSVRIRDWRQIYIGDVEATGGFGTFDALYGIYIENIGGSANPAIANWALYSKGGMSSHAGNFRFGDNTAPVLGVLEVKGASFFGDPGTNELQVSATGDLLFLGTAGLPYGSFWGNEINFVTAGGTGSFTEVSDPDITVGQTHLATFQNNKEIAVTNAGVYEVIWSICVKATGANKHIVGGIGVDAGGTGALTIQNDGRNHAVSTGNAEFPLSGAALLDLSASSEVGLMVTNTVDDTDVAVEHVNLTLIQVGGT